MNRSFLLSRFVRYFRLNGITRTIWKAFDKIKESLFRKPEVLFFIDLVTRDENNFVLPDNFTIQCLRRADDIPSRDLETLFQRHGEKIIRYDIKDRFGKGALLWLVKVDGTLAGYIWSISGRSIRPHYFPLTDKDVSLFDNYVLKEFRGQGINPKLINYVIGELQRKGLIRVYIETDIANTAEIRSLTKTDFKQFGTARKYNAGERSFVMWSKKKFLSDG